MDDNGLIEVPFVRVHVTSGVMSQKFVEVFAHEIPILMTTHGEDNVQTLGATGDTRWLHPGEEYARLQNRYGGSKKGTRVEEVFGKNMEGRLAELMGRSLKMFPLPSAKEVAAEEERKTPEATKPKPKGRTRLKSKSTD